MSNFDLPMDRYDTLRSLRTKLGMTQEQAAKAIGVSVSTLKLWEKDSSKISFDHIKKIEGAYGVKHHYIFFGKESTFSELLKKIKVTA